MQITTSLGFRLEFSRILTAFWIRLELLRRRNTGFIFTLPQFNNNKNNNLIKIKNKHHLNL
jgi:hypothetical protein